MLFELTEMVKVDEMIGVQKNLFHSPRWVSIQVVKLSWLLISSNIDEMLCKAIGFGG